MQNRKLVLIISVVALSLGVGLSGCIAQDQQDSGTDDGPESGELDNEIIPSDKVETFGSKAEFREYLINAPETSRNRGFTGAEITREFSEDVSGAPIKEQVSAAKQSQKAGSGSEIRRSTTNVQVEGIDEPDLLKNTAENIYFSTNRFDDQVTKVIDARPPEDAAVDANISEAGKLLLHDDVLMVFQTNRILGYDVSDPKEPRKKWSRKLNASLETSRLKNGKVYIVLSEDVDRGNPCPIRPMEEVSIPCTSIYRPNVQTDVDVTYNVFSLDPETGEVGDKTSMVGSSGNSVVYMSTKNLYLTYPTSTSATTVYFDFLANNTDLVGENVTQRIEKLEGYDISEEAKQVEVREIIDGWLSRFGEDERKTKETELSNRFRKYLENNRKKLQGTGIAKIPLNSLEVAETGTVPGNPLNQWSLDEYEGDLRIATTVSSRSIQGLTPVNHHGFRRSHTVEVGGSTENDVYVLDGNLERRGSVQGMGLDERIYSVRFMGDRGYVVTYRRIDPFHVLDLSNPDDPTLEGELKLPGFSSYLHPLEKNRILGVGKEDGEVKVVIFDVSNPADPKVESDYILSDYDSEVVDTHRAFLQDPKHEVFFIPGREAGYVFSYSDGLELKKALKIDNPRRAAYIGDSLYVLSDSEMVVVDEKSWDRVKTLNLGDDERRPHPPPTGPGPIIPDR
ncbi:MAG: beta-propeller domain-containing protein [Halobacteria archaeon]